jgi:hypothetical protein
MEKKGSPQMTKFIVIICMLMLAVWFTQLPKHAQPAITTAQESRDAGKDGGPDARTSIATNICMRDTPYAENEKCYNLTPYQIDHYFQERLQEIADVRRRNKEQAEREYLGCLIAKGAGNHHCDFLIQ